MKRYFIFASIASTLIAATDLHTAAYNDDVDSLERLVRSGVDVKAANRYGVTALELACTNGNARMVEILLKAGASPNTKAAGGEPVLMTCARTGNVDAVKPLLAAGADLKAKEPKRGQTALMWAAAEGHVQTVETLIKAGAAIEDRLDSGFTALLLAVREGQLGAVKALIQAGASANDTITRPDGVGPQPSGAPRTGVTALHLAVTNAHHELASYLLEAGADPNAIGPGYTALHIISNVRKPGVGDNDPAPRGSGAMSSLELVRKLVQHGANVNARMTKKIGIGATSLNTLGSTPFLLAARSGDAELMRSLAELGADPKIPTADGATPLIVAAGLGTRSPGEDAGTEDEVLEAVQVALELGNDINAVDKNGETAMHGAAYKNLPRVVEYLASRGADIRVWHQKNKHGRTPLTIARGYRFGNYKPSPTTVTAFHKVMLAAGVSPDKDPVPTLDGNSEYKKP
ncbi:MAG TPA: ankyrin repeat domain-containing protein [Bryobacteraceae bacterium]|nr:ankyrin repeat domain-containing protein [Bryobacteraceae bacterium]